VVLHVALEVEIGKLIILGHLEELGELLVGVDDTAILLVLKTISLDIGVDLLADVSASHLSTNGLAEELGELVADAGGLHEARGLAVTGVTALLGGGLLGSLDLTGNSLLKGLEIILDRGEKTNKLLKLGVKLSELKSNGGGSIDGCSINGLGSRGKLVGNGLRSRGSSLDLLGLGGRGRSSGGGNSGGGGNNGSRGRLIRGLRGSNHAGYYTILSRLPFKLF